MLCYAMLGTTVTMTVTTTAAAAPAVVSSSERRTEHATRPGGPAGGPSVSSFPLLPGEGLPLRIMTDLGSVEVFAAGGRGVHSGGLSYAACAHAPCQLTAMAASAGAAPPTLTAGAAWEMSSIFS